MNLNIEKKRSIVAQMVRRDSIQEKSFDRDFWIKAGHEVRFAASWEIIHEIAAIRGINGECESGLQRSVQHIQHRKG